MKTSLLCWVVALSGCSSSSTPATDTSASVEARALDLRAVDRPVDARAPEARRADARRDLAAADRAGDVGPLTSYTWKLVGQLPTPRSELTGVELGGKIYTIGGNDGTTPNLYHTSNVVEIFDPLAGTWSTAAPTPTRRYSCAAAVLDGKIWVLGGHHETTVSRTNEVEILDPVTNAWSSGKPMQDKRQELAAAVVNGKLYAIGGTPDGSIRLDTTEVYDPVAQTWSYRAKAPRGRTGASATVLGGKIYVVGGIDAADNYLAAIDVYDPGADSWSTLAASLPDTRWMAGAVTFHGQVVVTGGTYYLSGKGMQYLDSVLAFSPAGGAPATLAAMPLPRAEHAAVVVDDAVYVLGGTNSQSAYVGGVYKLAP